MILRSFIKMNAMYKGWAILCFFTLLYAARLSTAQLPISLVSPDMFPPVPKQLSVKIEMVLMEDKLVEEFAMNWDEQLQLARFDYSLGRIMPPYNTPRPMKTVQDYGNGMSFNMDGVLPNCTMAPLRHILTDANLTSTGTSYSYWPRPRRLIGQGNITLDDILRTLHPKQLFYMNDKSRVLNKTAKETIRGIPCEMWTVYVDNYYIPGYGPARTRHNLYFMTKEFTKQLLGEVPHMIPVQRTVFLETVRSSSSFLFQNPIIVFNFFDFTVPIVPSLYDFSISQCIPKGKLETRESIQFSFPGNTSGARPDLFYPQFRRQTLLKIIAVGQLSPIRVVGVFPSQDARNLYITATVLPRPPAQLYFTKISASGKARFARGYNPQISNMTSDQFGVCAKACLNSMQGCQKFSWCTKDNESTGFKKCVQKLDEEVGDTLMPTRNANEKTDIYTCDVFQRIINSTVYDGQVLESLFKILRDVQEEKFNVTIDANGTVVFLQAEDMRTDVSLNEDSTISASPADSRTAFDFYKGQTSIINSAAKEQHSRLSPSECRRRCLDEKRFTCQSVASCAYGDCILSDLHSDELLNSSDGKPNLLQHTHCAVWTIVTPQINWIGSRQYGNGTVINVSVCVAEVKPFFALGTWKGMFTLASLLVPRAPPDRIISGVSSEDTCAKQCLFGNFSCESFSFCPQEPIVIGRPPAAKVQHDCHLYKSHAFDVMQEERDFKKGCWHLSRNYVYDFEASPGYEIVTDDAGIIDIEPALERWHCAKECIDHLGDDGCLAFDICEDLGSLTDEVLGPDIFSNNMSDGTVRCRISSSYIGVLSNSSRKVRSNENCTLYTRTTYLDGTSVNPKTVAATKKDNPLSNAKAELQAAMKLVEVKGYSMAELQAAMKQVEVKGYSMSDMAGLGVSMIICGAIITAVVFVVLKKISGSRGASFTRDIPFSRLSS